MGSEGAWVVESFIETGLKDGRAATSMEVVGVGHRREGGAARPPAAGSYVKEEDEQG